MQPLCHGVCFEQEGRGANDLALMCHLHESRGQGRFARVGSTEQGWRTQLEHARNAVGEITFSQPVARA